MTDASTPSYDPRALAMPREFVLQNGLRIITLSTPTLETARMAVRVNSGSRDDVPGLEGSAHFLEHMMFNGSFLKPGTKALGAKTANMQKFKNWGGGLNAATGKTRTQYGFETDNYSVLNKNLEEAATIVLDIMQHPRLKEEEVARENPVIRTEIADKKDMAGAIAYGAACHSLYPASNMLHQGLGTPESVNRITAADLREFWNKHYVPENTAIYIQGKGSDQELLKIVTDRLTTLGSERPSLKRPPLEAVPADVRVPYAKTDKLCYRFSWESGRQGVSELNLKEEVIVGALHGILSNEFNIKMRDQERQVYGCGTYRDDTGASVFMFDSEQSPEKLTKSFGEFIKNMDGYLTQETLDDYKNRVTIKYAKFFESPKDVALSHANRLLEGKDVYRCDDRLAIINALTLEEIREMAKRIFGKPFGLAVTGNPELLAQVPPKETIEVAMDITPNDKPVAGSFASSIKPYDARHGQTEPLPNPIRHSRSNGAMAIG